MSPIQNNHFCQYIPPGICSYYAGIWTDKAGDVAGTICKRYGPTGTGWRKFWIPIQIPSSPTLLTGACLISLEIDYQIKTTAPSSGAWNFRLFNSNGDGSALTYTNPVVTYDANHDTSTKRRTVAKHRMTVTLSSPPWIFNTQFAMFDFEFNSGAGTVFDFFGAFANFYWRD